MGIAIFIPYLWLQFGVHLYSLETSQTAFWKPDHSFTAFGFFHSVTSACYPSVSRYWLCKRRTLTAEQICWLALLSQASRKAGVEGKKDFDGREENEWQGEKGKKKKCIWKMRKDQESTATRREYFVFGNVCHSTHLLKV